MKRSPLLPPTLMLLFSLGCEGPIDEPSPAGADQAVDGTTQMIVTHLGPEKRTAAALLPAAVPVGAVAQERWDRLRAGTVAPRTVAERKALGMSTVLCGALTEHCDVHDCDGVDNDTASGPDGVDERELPSVNQASLAAGWDDCRVPESPTLRCNHREGRGRVYTGVWDYGQPTTSTLGQGDIVIFTDSNFGGYCARAFNAGFGTVSNMGGIYPSNVFKDTMSSFRYGGTAPGGTNAIEFWDFSGFPIWSPSWWTHGPVELAVLSGWNDRAASFKVGH
jgi:hypothetical protein